MTFRQLIINSIVMTRALLIVLALVLLLLQYQLWFSGNGLRETAHLYRIINVEKKQNDKLLARNDRLKAEIVSLKNDGNAIEDHARNDLGMIKKGEVFYRVVPAEGH
jgi:cell division protein FtsB